MADEHVATKRCTRCGIEKRLSEFNRDKYTGDGLQCKCRVCQKEVRRDWYVRNREREIAKSVQWAKANPEKVTAKERMRSIKHPGRTTKYSREWRKRNPQQASAASAAWKISNKDRIRRVEKDRYAREPHKSLAKCHKRRAAMMGNGGTYSDAQVRELFDLQSGKCASCKQRLARFHCDHVTPLSKGGRNDILNIQLLCPTCNHKKAAKHSVEFMQEMGFLL